MFLMGQRGEQQIISCVQVYSHIFNFSRLYTYLKRQMHGRIFNTLHVLLRFIAHLGMAYAITFWTCYVLLKEYEIISKMRLRFLASEKRRPDQFTVCFFNSATLLLFIIVRFGSTWCCISVYHIE